MPITGHTKEYHDADNLRQAFAMVSSEINIIEKTRKYCGKKLTESKYSIDYHSYVWTQTNEKEIFAVNSFLKKGNKSEFIKIRDIATNTVMLALKSAGLLKSKEICTDFVVKLNNGQRNISTRTPRASKFLLNYFKTQPLNNIEEDKYNYYNGCVKSGLNKNTDYDLIKSYCNCAVDVKYIYLTKAERIDMGEAARINDNLKELPQVIQMKPMLMECAAKAKESLTSR